jgi:hypothetical protein
VFRCHFNTHAFEHSVIMPQAATGNASAFAGAQIREEFKDVFIFTHGERCPVMFKSSDEFDGWLTRARWRSVCRADQKNAREVFRFEELESGVTYVPVDESLSARVWLPVFAA